jgi:hypothetical protein
MSAIAIETVELGARQLGTRDFEGGKYVQQMFDWDAPAAPAPNIAQPALATNSLATSVVASNEPANTPAAPKNLRRGRCEHVGGVMGAVLSKYGLGIDDLLRAIEERQAQLSVSR